MNISEAERICRNYDRNALRFAEEERLVFSGYGKRYTFSDSSSVTVIGFKGNTLMFPSAETTMAETLIKAGHGYAYIAEEMKIKWRNAWFKLWGRKIPFEEYDSILPDESRIQVRWHRKNGDVYMSTAAVNKDGVVIYIEGYGY